MYFLSINDLVRSLGDRDQRDDESFKYFFAYLMILGILTELPEATAWNHWDTAGAIGTVIVNAAGMIYCYRVNGGGGGTAFLSRYFAITWVITLRLILVFLPVFFVATIAAEALGAITEVSSWWDTLIGLGMEVIAYALVAKHLLRVRVLRGQLDAALGPQPV